MYNITYYTTVLLLFLAATVTRAQEIWDVTYPKREVRAVWIATIGGIDWPRTKATDGRSTERQQRELTAILDKLKEANINTVLLQTRIRGSVIYPSDIEPWDNAITGRAGKAPTYDPLAFAVEECHKRGMELHAWIVSIPLGTVSRQQAYGSKSITKHHKNLCRTVNGNMFMIPGLPETADYIAGLAKEIVDRYDVDGINLDYIRYPESEYHFSDDYLYSSRSGLSKADWRRSNITRIVRKVHDAVKAVKPWVKLSSSPIGKYKTLNRYQSGGWDCFNAVYQDPQAWLREDIQDMLFPMMYFQGDHYYPFVYDWKENCYGHPVAAGLGIYFLDPKEGRHWQLNDVRAQMHAARKSGMGGIAFYRSDYLTGNIKGLYDTTCEEFFPFPALSARMTWSGDTIAPASPTGIRYKDGVLTWSYGTALTDGQWQSVYFNVYGSNTYPVDITKAENLLDINLTAPRYEIVGRALNKHFFAVTAIDRFGNESVALQEQNTSSTSRPSEEDIFAAVHRHFSGDYLEIAKASKRGKRKTAEAKTEARETAKAEKPEKEKREKAKKEKKTNPANEIRVIDFSKYLY